MGGAQLWTSVDIRKVVLAVEKCQYPSRDLLRPLAILLHWPLNLDYGLGGSCTESDSSGSEADDPDDEPDNPEGHVFQQDEMSDEVGDVLQQDDNMIDPRLLAPDVNIVEPLPETVPELSAAHPQTTVPAERTRQVVQHTSGEG